MPMMTKWEAYGRKLEPEQLCGASAPYYTHRAKRKGRLVLCALENLGPISSVRNIPKIKRNFSDIR